MEKQIIKQGDTKSIRYPQSVDEKIEKLAKGFKRSKKELFCQMVDYFYRSKKDPDDPGDELLKRELSAGIDRIIAFIKRQEKDFLLPIFTDNNVLKTASLKQRDILEAVVKHLVTESEHATTLAKQIDQVINILKHLMTKQKDKDTLKQQFSELLEYYISQREEMNWTTSAVKKEELITHVRKTLKSL